MTKTILITRPEPAASNTARQLNSLDLGVSFNAIASPLLAALTKPFAWPTQNFESIVLTSARAVENLAALPNQIANCKTYTVGSTTAEAARHAGFKNIADLPKRINTVQLLVDHLAKNITPASVLYLCGEQRTKDLAKLLAPFHVQTTLIETYSMTPIPLSDQAQLALSHGEIFAVAHYSSATANRFIKVTKPFAKLIESRAPHHICMSQNIADILARSAFENIHLAQTPTQGAMLDVCKKIIQQP